MDGCQARWDHVACEARLVAGTWNFQAMLPSVLSEPSLASRVGLVDPTHLAELQ